MGSEIYAAVQSFFRRGKLLREWNVVAITLAPKSNNASKISDFRPISCCTVLYKTISKILASRLNRVVEKVISSNQSGFVKGRNIKDNIMVAQDIVRKYGRKRLSQRCTVKIDIHKAYDSVRWDFIQQVLSVMEFPPQFTSRIMECVTSPSFSVCINGSLEGFFMGEKWLRQGYPISPYLFVIVMEVFTSIMRKMASESKWNWHLKCDAKHLS